MSPIELLAQAIMRLTEHQNSELQQMQQRLVATQEEATRYHELFDAEVARAAELEHDLAAARKRRRGRKPAKRRRARKAPLPSLHGFVALPP